MFHTQHFTDNLYSIFLHFCIFVGMVFLFVDLEKLIYYIMILKHNQTKIDYISSDLTTGLQTNFYNLYFAVTCVQLCTYNVGIGYSEFQIDYKNY